MACWLGPSPGNGIVGRKASQNLPDLAEQLRLSGWEGFIHLLADGNSLSFCALPCPRQALLACLMRQLPALAVRQGMEIR